MTNHERNPDNPNNNPRLARAFAHAAIDNIDPNKPETVQHAYDMVRAAGANRKGEASGFDGALENATHPIPVSYESTMQPEQIGRLNDAASAMRSKVHVEPIEGLGSCQDNALLEGMVRVRISSPNVRQQRNQIGRVEAAVRQDD